MNGTFDLDRVRALIDDGESLAAYDLAMSIEAPVDDPVAGILLTYLRALSLARAGATSRAAEVIAQISLTDEVPTPLCEDVGALSARLAKDQALSGTGGDRIRAFGEAARRYGDVADRYGRPFAMVNAASMWLLHGDDAQARAYARRALDATAADSSDFWDVATRAEATLVLGDVETAAGIVKLAGGMAHSGGTRATTRRQLKLLCEHLGLSHDILAPLANPDVAHFGGHMRAVVSAMSDGALPGLDQRIRSWLDLHQIGDAYGALAFGADIVLAEALLDHGARLHVVLPVDVDQFVDISVRPGGDGWVRRFERCVASAASMEVTFEGRYEDDPGVLAYASDIAMGDAVTRARWLEADAVQLMVWDGRSAQNPAGTARDVTVWERRGNRTVVFDVPVVDSVDAPVVAATSPPRRRRVGVAVFGDFVGFSGLRDEQHLPFFEQVMAAVAEVIHRHGDAVIQRNTWGDGILLILEDVGVAADLALGVQERLVAIDMEAIGLPASLRLRLAAHAGPVLPVTDPVLGTPTLVGRSLTRAARIEPRTPPGEVYVTSAFAALLAMIPDASATTEYVGRMTTAKDFETLPMYVLRRAGTPVARQGSVGSP